MTQNLKIEVLTGDISIDGMVVTNLVTKEELSTAIVKKADLGADGKIPTTQLPENILNTSTIVGEVKLQLETSIKDAVDESNAYAESYTDNALSSKADLTSGKVPLEQLPTIDQYPQFGTALSNLSTSILTSVKQRTDQLEKSKADLGEDGKVLREQIPSYEKISGLPEQLEVMSTQTAAVSGELDQHKLQMFVRIDTLKENIEANVQQLTDRQSHLMRTYATKELGVDAKVGVKPSEYFYVRSTEEDTVLVEYQNVGGVPTPSGKSYPSSAYIQMLSEDLNGVSEFVAQPFEQSRAYIAGQKALIMSGAGVRSLEDNNATDPNTNMSKWAFIEHLIFKSRVEMLAYANPKTGQVAHLLSVHALNFALLKPQDGGGFFIYDESKANENDGGTIFNGWIRQYSGDVDISWFGAVQGADASPFIESALKVNKSVVSRGNYTLETVCGLPDQSNYNDTVIRIRGENQATFTVNCPAGAVFTSSAAKLNPTSLTNLYTGKIDVSGINFVGTTVANSVIFNGDRLYNMDIHQNNFHGNVTIVKAYLKREAGRQYTQSTSIFKNHLTNVYRVIETDKAYNFDFSYNLCEACIGGMYIGVDAPWDPNAISLTINRNLWEGGGMLLKTNGGIVAGSVSKNYFEANTAHDAAIEKCLISIDRSGDGAGNSSGLVFESNLFSGTASIPDYVDVRFVNLSTETIPSSKGALTKAPVFIGNWSDSARITNFDSVALINNRCVNRATMKNAYSSQEGRVSFISGYNEKVLADILSANTLSVLNIDTNPCLISDYAGTNFKASIDVNLYFKTPGAVNTASASFKLDVFVYTPFGAWQPPKAGLKATMSGFMQSTGSDVIIPGANMFAPFANPLLSVVDNGDGTYVLQLSDFTNISTPNWGRVTYVRVEYTISGTLIASEIGGYSTLNFMAVS